MKTLRYVGRVITPVHIGTGETIDPLDYVVKDGKLVRYAAASVIADLPTEERSRLQGMIECGELASLHNFFRNHVDAERHAVAVVGASAEVAREFEEKCTNPNNQLKVHPMVRNLHTGRSYVPGSSLKGAIRTAVVSKLVNEEPQKGQFENVMQQEHNDRRRAQALQEITLKFEHRRMENDPFRLLKVADADLPEGSTRVDKVVNYKPGRQLDMPLDMWERVLSASEGADVRFEVGIRFDDGVLAHPVASKHVGRRLVWEEMVEACNDFYFRRLIDEMDRFFPQDQKTLTRPRVFRPFAELTPGDARTVKRPRSPLLLLRIGRFSQFESLSVDTFRKGGNLRAKREIHQGATRNLLVTATRLKRPDGTAVTSSLRLPFGWVLLSPAEGGAG